ncbi:hypothetical protein FRX31_012483 [Thalictrum thalictroides]|uniref:Uncharacterized protein n=1 Tax=Thalictrum thalictroides TaxID=46969 RepID=A0A7J6WP74_THATH|nr:hypothetical protein FRX31_012483 [Thalictrum thalictroides]
MEFLIKLSTPKENTTAKPTRDVVTVKEALQAWPQIRGSRVGRVIWQTIPAAVLWSTLKARNNVIFKGDQFSSSSLIKSVKMNTWAWLEISIEGAEVKRDIRAVDLLFD